MQCMHGPNCKLGSFCTTGRRLQEVNVLGGLILPVWGTVEKALSKQVCQLVFLYCVRFHEIHTCVIIIFQQHEMIKIIEDEAQVVA